MYPERDLEDEILSTVRKMEGISVPQLISTILTSIGDDGPSRRTVRRVIDNLADRGYFNERPTMALFTTAKARRAEMKCQEEA